MVATTRLVGAFLLVLALSSGTGSDAAVLRRRVRGGRIAAAQKNPECGCVPNGLETQKDGKIKREGDDGKASYFPGDYGSSCKAHDAPLDPLCDSEFPPAYCQSEWCYVPEDCEVSDKKQSMYFPGKPLYYSYKNCGSLDAFTAQACLAKDSKENCKDPCAWNKGVCQNKLCQCTHDNGLKGKKAEKWGADYGEQCSAWDQDSCSKWGDEGSDLGMWCCKRWCYVDESCPSAKPSAVDKGLFYSYYACPDVADEVTSCPWKKPITFSGDPLPLTPAASKALNQQHRVKDATGTHPENCHNLFAYEDSVKMCMALQEKICGKSCDLVMKDDEKCPEMQKLLCVHPPMPAAQKAVKVEPKIPPTNDETAFVTVCNAYPSAVNVDIHHNKFYILPNPVVVEDLEYMQCVQFEAEGEEELILSVGGHSKGLHVMGDDVNHLVLFGQFELGKKDPGFRHFGWKDDGFGRPVVCSAYPAEKPGKFFQDGDSNYPFSNPQNTKGLLGYMECDVLALDKKELQMGAKKMGADFEDGKHLTFEVAASSTLYLIGDDPTTHEPRMKDYHFKNLKNELEEKDNSRRFYVPHYPELMGKPPMTSA